MEVETQILIAQEQSYMNQSQTESLLNLTAKIGRLLNGLMNSLAEKKEPTTDHRPPTTA
jgi:four helix bundle protein